MLYACDAAWWIEYFPELARAFHGQEMWTISRNVADMFKLDFVFGAAAPGLPKHKKHIHTGLNGGYQAISLAHMWGCSKLILLGYDFQRSKGRVHWHTDHPKKLGNGGRFHEWVREMGKLAIDAKSYGLDIVNCSRSTALTCFRQSTIQQELKPDDRPHAAATAEQASIQAPNLGRDATDPRGVLADGLLG